MIAAHPITWSHKSVPSQFQGCAQRTFFQERKKLDGPQTIFWSAIVQDSRVSWNLGESSALRTPSLDLIWKILTSIALMQARSRRWITSTLNPMLESSMLMTNFIRWVRNPWWVQRNHCQLISLKIYTPHINCVAWKEKMIFLSSWCFSKHFSLVY